jgi:hypothetical protein
MLLFAKMKTAEIKSPVLVKSFKEQRIQQAVLKFRQPFSVESECSEIRRTQQPLV